MLASNKAAAAAHGLGERAHPHIHFAGVNAEIFMRAAPGLAKHAQRMGLIHQQHAVILLFQLDDAGQVRDIAVHTEQALGDDDGPLVLRALGLEHFFKGVAIIMIVGVTRGVRKACALHQRVVGQAVMKDGVAVTE